MPGPKTPKGRKRRREELHRPTRTKFYILDYDGQDNLLDDYGMATPHFQKSRNAKRCIQKNFDADIICKAFDPNSLPEDVLTWLKDEIDQWSEGCLAILYVEAGGGFNGVNYKWNFEGGPRLPVNAHQFIQILVDSGFDCMLILDAYIPTRYHNRWKPSYGENDDNDNDDDVVDTGNVEIIVRGEPLQDTAGEKVLNDRGEFSRCVFSALDDLVYGAKIPEGERFSYAHWKPLTILELLARKMKQMSSNPYRLWLKRTRYGDDTIVDRMVLDPSHINTHQKIVIHLARIQGPRKQARVVEEAEDPAAVPIAPPPAPMVAPQQIPAGEPGGRTPFRRPDLEEDENQAPAQDEDEDEDEGIFIPENDQFVT